MKIKENGTMKLIIYFIMEIKIPWEISWFFPQSLESLRVNTVMRVYLENHLSNALFILWRKLS